MAVTRFLGVDLAWREGRDDLPANETGVAVLDPAGRILDAGWTRGVPDTLDWADAAAGGRDAVMFVDASLVVTNPAGQRRCETQVGQRYGAWKVSAHSTNLRSPRLAGVRLLSLAGQAGWRYSDGRAGPPASGRVISESFPHCTLVGAAELGYDRERPRYKRQPRRLPVAEWRPRRAATCDELIRRLGRLASADPPLRLDSHPVTRQLAGEPSPLGDVGLQAPGGPDRRAALCLDRGAVGAARAAPVPGARPAGRRRGRDGRRTGRDDHCAGPARAARHWRSERKLHAFVRGDEAEALVAAVRGPGRKDSWPAAAARRWRARPPPGRPQDHRRRAATSWASAAPIS